MEFFFYVCSLPASACSAAAKTTSAEATKTASATKTSATAKASAAEATSHGNPDGLVTSAGIVLVAVTGTENKDEGDDDKKDEPNGYAFAVIVVFVLGELARTEVHDDIDGVINALDVVKMMRQIVGWKDDQFDPVRVDFNHDGRFNAKDVLLVMLAIVNDEV